MSIYSVTTMFLEKTHTHNLQKTPYFIAEAGNNHRGSLEIAESLVKAAADSGADAVKFQLFSLESLWQPEQFEKALNLDDSSWRQEIRALSLPLEWLPKLKSLADSRQIDLLCTPFDIHRLKLCAELGLPAIKIASGDLTCLPLLREAAGTGLPIILSAGASSLEEIQQSLDITGREKSVLLDCVMQYPASVEDYSPHSLQTLEQICDCAAGISDHSKGALLPILAALGGARVIERHFTLDSSWPGADHAMSVEPGELKQIVQTVRDASRYRQNADLQLKGKETAREQELARRPDNKERIYARRGLYAQKKLPRGKILEPDDLIWLRPAFEAVPVARIDEIYGLTLSRELKPGDAIRDDIFA